MPEYSIRFKSSAEKQLGKLEKSLARRILAAIEALADNPRPSGCRKLRGETNLWRVRVGDYRVVYSVHDSARLVRVFAVRHREGAY